MTKKADKKRRVNDALTQQGFESRMNNFNDVRRYAERLVDPEGQDAALAPSPISTRGNPVKDKIVIDLAEYYDPAGGSSGDIIGIVRPTPDNTLELTSSVPDDFTADPVIMTATGTANVDDFDPANAINASHGRFKAIGVPEEGSDRPSIEVEVDPAIGGNNTVCSLSHDLENIALRMSLISKNVSTGERKVLYTGDVVGGTKAEFPAEIGHKYLWLECLANGVPRQYTAQIIVTPQTESTIKLSARSNVTQSIGLDLLSDVPSLEYYRVTALGILGTYSGSSLANGGRVAAAKVSRYFRINEDSVLNDLAKLPNDSYNGPLKDGFHMHWLPATIDDLVPRGASDPYREPLFNYMFAIHADDRTQSMRLQVTMHLEYFSTSSIYGAMAHTPASVGLSPMLEYLAMIPVATENAGHMAAKLLAVLASAGKSGLKWALAHPDLVRTAGVAALAVLNKGKK